MYGQITDDTYFKREHERTKLRIAGGSWTLNMAELNNDVVNIIFTTNKGTYKIKYDKAKEKGFYRKFQDELKLVVPEKYWEFIKKEDYNESFTK